MGNLGKITSVKRIVDGQLKSLAKCLSEEYGRNRQHGTFQIMSPKKLIGGKYLTGFDEDADYIKKMSPEEAEQEKAYIRRLRERAESMLANVKLDNDSPFYLDMTKKYGSDDVCPFVKLQEGDNIFNLDDPYDIVKYAYLRVHNKVAPSGEALFSGDYANCEWYVNDSDVETEKAYRRKSKIVKANKIFEELSESKRLIIARQCGLPVSDTSSPKEVYNVLSDYIDASKVAKTQGNVDTFMKYAEMKDQHLQVRNILDLAIAYNVYRKTKMGIFNGEVSIGRTKEEAIQYLSDPLNQRDLLAAEEAIKMKKSIKQ